MTNDRIVVAGLLPHHMKDLAQSLTEITPAMERLVSYGMYPSDPDLTEEQMEFLNYSLCQLAAMDVGYVASRVLKGVNELFGPEVDQEGEDFLLGLSRANADYADYNESHFEVHPDCPTRPESEDFIRIHRAQAEIFRIIGEALQACMPHFQTLALRDLYDGTHDEEAPGL